MKRLVHSLKGGEMRLAETPQPVARPGQVLIANSFSLVSAGTEKMTIELAQKSLLGKAKERPDQVRRVLEKLRNEGFWNTFDQVRAKLDEPMSMGYSSAGVVLACGEGVQGIRPGDRVASNGPHAEVVSVPKHLCALVPQGVPMDQAAFTVLGAIALQGVRLSQAALGETVLVIGLGLIGQIAVVLLNASGIRVLGTDPDGSKCELALKMGAVVAMPGLTVQDVEGATKGLGADAVIITASTTSNAPIELASAAVRKRGRIVLVGVVGLELDRRPFYFKECEFVVSSSYGPGRYDPLYEERGQDYPAAYVRWTEQRNMQAVLDLMGRGALDVSPLITHRFSIDKAQDAYALITEAREPYLGILLEYPGASEEKARAANASKLVISSPVSGGKVGLGVVGAGNFARMVLLPAALKSGSMRPVAICSGGGLSAGTTREKHGFETAVENEEAVFAHPGVSAVIIATRHDLHGSQVLQGMAAKKAVFVEKPLCLTVEELASIDSMVTGEGEHPPLMVGFNRRFSPAAESLKTFFSKVQQPLTISIRFNAGQIPSEHWTQDEAVGGGRIIGEACHAIDLATFLAGAPPVRVFAESVGGVTASDITDDQCAITLRHANGTLSSILYTSSGDKGFPKERVEVYGGGKVGVIEDFRKAIGVSAGKTKVLWSGGQDKGHAEEMRVFGQAVLRGGEWPIPWRDLRAVTLTSILAVRSLREGVPFDMA
jgi:predicted dehydrogenase/threonine dehydrogenase-like Zn-dependent dehydrogenase